MSIEEIRKAFEAWAYSNKWNIFRVRDMGIDKYVDDFVDGAWHGWLASANREGCKLVPVDSLKEIISCAYCHIHDRCIGDEGDDVINHILAMGVEDED